MNEEKTEKSNDNFKKIAKQYYMLNKKMHLEGNYSVKRFFALKNRYLVDEHKKISKKYWKLLQSELKAKSNDPAEFTKVFALYKEYYNDVTKIKQDQFLTFALSIIIISALPSLITILSMCIDKMNPLLAFERIVWTISAIVFAIIISCIYLKKTWSLKWLNFICSILSGSLSILNFIFPESSKINFISAIVIFYLIVQAFISWEETNLDWKNKVLDEIKQTL
ncbi:hypothetical protein [Lactobacillus apis]|uniref:hypothetical protein n=1 Tax=Lactobacillus apis TaxID=303541 RepID=UPI0016505142|nr:hypothetical protein [Lactobacillus apis]MBC6360758.1 hypothetical protein [Lactobacillus apis]